MAGIALATPRASHQTASVRAPAPVAKAGMRLVECWATTDGIPAIGARKRIDRHWSGRSSRFHAPSVNPIARARSASAP